jgi:hypothetical protein
MFFILTLTYERYQDILQWPEMELQELQEKKQVKKLEHNYSALCLQYSYLLWDSELSTLENVKTMVQNYARDTEMTKTSTWL